MDSRTPIGVDTETHLFGPGNMAPKIVCVSGAVGRQEVLALRDGGGIAWATDVLESAAEGAVVATLHNASYDAACLLEEATRTGNTRLLNAIWGAYDKLGIHCTYVRERLIDIAKGTRSHSYALDSVALWRLGREMDKETYRTNYGQLDGVPVEEWSAGARQYAIDDAVVARDVWEHQEEQVSRMDYRAWTDESGRQSAFAFALQLMKCRGVMVDQGRARALREAIAPKMLVARQKMADAGLIDPKKGSKIMKAMRAMVEASWLGDGPIPRTPKGEISTAADTLEQCSAPGLVAAVEFAHYEKLSSSFLAKLEAAGDMPIHSTFNPLVDSGRTSSSDPNLQQQPREPGVRECFRAREGMVLLACDYDSQEVRAFAQVLMALFGRSNLATRYREDPNYDPHTHFASELLKISYAEGIARKKAKDPVFKEWRQRSKAAIFGFPGGMGVNKFRIYARGYGLELSEDEAKHLKLCYYAFEPVVRDYFNVISNWCGEDTATVEQLYSGRVRGGCYFPAAANTMFQGLGADITKSALWEVTKKCYGAPGTTGSALLGCRPVVFVHDELILEAPEEYAHEAALELEETMVTAMQELTPDVPARATPALMRHWSKEADAVFDASGRYIPWEDRARRAA